MKVKFCPKCGYIITNIEYWRIKFNLLCPRCDFYRLDAFESKEILSGEKNK
jgi:hypothetical protein